MYKKQSTFKRGLSFVLALGVALGSIPLSRLEEVHAASSPEFRYFAEKSDWSEAKLTDDSKAIKVKMGTVPSTVSGASYQPTDSNIGLTVGDPLTWWIVG